MRITQRLTGIGASQTMMVMQRAQELRSRGIDVIDLGPGQPDFPTPDAVKQAGIAAIDANFTNYTPAAGILELRQSVADTYNRDWGTRFDAGNVIITSGAKHALFDACMAVFQEGDEVLIPCPYWVTFPEIVKICGGVPVEVPTDERDRFILSPDEVSARVTPQTRGLVVNTPNNPTGAIIPPAHLAELVEIARSRDLFLLFDETYDRFTYAGKKHTSLAASVRDSDEAYAIVGSFSKTYSMAGWRIGYCVGPKPLIAKLIEFQSHQTGNPTSVSQKAAVVALQLGAKAFEPMRVEYERRRDYVLKALDGINGFRCPQPDGTFYVFPNVEGAMKATGMGNSHEFSNFLLQEARVATVPGSAFGLEGYIRLSYATSLDRLQQGLERIRSVVS
ncbi:MAG: pyridoxal phosphate-dependent aminotransferase [Acidobacteriota bacterium]|nr:MAG: pyridoxal phosphate-dependent aminotransferase [Acidobacteriota bacterium]